MTSFFLETKEQLISYFQKGEKASKDFKIGTEFEQFLFEETTNKRVPYEGKTGIKSILEEFTEFGWTPVFEKQYLIGLKHLKASQTISLEPGGQIELSGSPLLNLHDVKHEIDSYQQQLDSILTSKNIRKVALGFDPITKRDDVPLMPKGRYKIMQHYMPKKGNHGLDMMLQTCTVQVNLDYATEKDMVKKFRVAMGLQPILSALFANSFLVEGKDSGYKSYRNFIWQNTDPDRCGLLPFVFDKNMGYERYVDYLLDVPMYFVYRQGYLNTAGQSFRDFLAKKLPGVPGESPTPQDWIDQMSVAFPEVRLKRFLELRAADCGEGPFVMALPALWVGLLYDLKNLDYCHELVQSFSYADILDVYNHVPKQGLATQIQGNSIQKLAQELVEKSKEGLIRRQQFSSTVQDESLYLNVLLNLF